MNRAGPSTTAKSGRPRRPAKRMSAGPHFQGASKIPDPGRIHCCQDAWDLERGTSATASRRPSLWENIEHFISCFAGPGAGRAGAQSEGEQEGAGGARRPAAAQLLPHRPPRHRLQLHRHVVQRASVLSLTECTDGHCRLRPYHHYDGKSHLVRFQQVDASACCHTSWLDCSINTVVS